MTCGYRVMALLAAAFLLTGCATVKEAVAPLVVDTYCLTAEKKKWSINDTPESIRDAQVVNATIDKRCKPKAAKS